MVSYPLKYGVVRLTAEVTLSNSRSGVELMFKKIGENVFQYRRKIGEVTVEKKLVIHDGVVGIYPTTPNIVYPEYSEYVYVKFLEEIVVESNSKAEFFIKAPLGVALTLSDNKMFDGFTLNEKHALYGSLVKGVLTRYYSSKIYFEKPNDIVFGESAVKIEINNTSNEVAKVGKVVFPATGTSLYYGVDGYEAFYANIIMKIMDQGIAEVIVSEEKPVENLIESPIKIGSPKKSFIMEWGI